MLVENNLVVGEEQHNGCPLPRGGRGRTTRSKAALQKMKDAVPAPDTLGSTQKTVSVEVEEASMRKRRTRRSRRTKVKAALDKNEEEVAVAANTEAIANSSVPAIGPAVILEKTCDDPKKEALMDKEDTKPRAGEMHYQDPSTYSVKRRTRRSRRPKAKMVLSKKEEVEAVGSKELRGQADSYDGVIGLVASDKSCGDFKPAKESVVEVGSTNFQEGIVEVLKQEAKLPSSTRGLARALHERARSKQAQYGLVRGGGSFIEPHVNPDTQDGEDGFHLTGVVDQSTLLVNTLDRFVNPMYFKSAIKEKKQGECWWMLM